MNSSLDISTSALVAQRMRLDAISSNLANMSSTRNERGESVPYRARIVTFQTDTSIHTPGGGNGVKIGSIEESSAPPQLRYQPGHQDANDAGYVAYPDIDMTTEFVNALDATRAYEANIGVMEITKDLGRQTLQIIA